MSLFKFDHIIHPTDFSETALNAYKYACEIAKHTQSKLTLLHVYEKPYYSTASSGGLMTFAVDSVGLSEIKENIAAEINKLAEVDFAKGVNLYKKLIADIPVWKFYEHVDVEVSDLIVMGTLGATGFLHGGLFGTNTERVIRHAQVPVLSVPDGVLYGGFKRIMFCTDYKDPLDYAYPTIARFAEFFGATIIIATINTPDRYTSSKQTLAAYNATRELYPYANVEQLLHNDNSVEEGIMDLVFEQEIDLVALLTHGRTGIAHLIHGSIAEDVSANLKVPLLTVKPQAPQKQHA